MVFYLWSLDEKLMAIVVLCASSTSFANKQSCAHYLRLKSRVEAANSAMLAVAWAPFSFPLAVMFATYSINAKREAERLKAAHILLDPEQSLKSKNNARQVINHFYERLVLAYPWTELTLIEVIKVLDEVYLNGATNGYCLELAPLPRYFSLKRTLFKDGKSQYQHFLMKRAKKEAEEKAEREKTETEKQELARQMLPENIAIARQYRDEQNELSGIENFHTEPSLLNWNLIE